jgi:hypothetical protein
MGARWFHVDHGECSRWFSRPACLGVGSGAWGEDSGGAAPLVCAGCCVLMAVFFNLQLRLVCFCF